MLRAKAQRLRGTSMSIDALLTPQQLSAKQQLLPVARQARAAGQSVHWRYATLYVAGKQYTGPGSLPSPAEQRETAAQQQQQQQQHKGWQTVQPRKQQTKQKVDSHAAFSKPKPATGGTAIVQQQAVAGCNTAATAVADKATTQQPPVKQHVQASQQPNTYAKAAASALGSKGSQQQAPQLAKDEKAKAAVKAVAAHSPRSSPPSSPTRA